MAALSRRLRPALVTVPALGQLERLPSGVAAIRRVRKSVCLGTTVELLIAQKRERHDLGDFHALHVKAAAAIVWCASERRKASEEFLQMRLTRACR